EEVVKLVDTGAWGKPQVARVVPNNQAAEAYEEVVRGRVDPALLEHAGGNTFQGRVFPIPARGYNRVLIAYEETLPVTQGRLVYRFPLPGQKLADMTFAVQGRAGECRAPLCNLDGTTREEKDGRVTFTRRWQRAKPQGDALVSWAPADGR